MKTHLPVVIALFTVALNLALVSGFVERVKHILRLQANATIKIPAAPPSTAATDRRHLRLTLIPSGAVYADETQVSDSSLAALIAADPAQRVIVATAPGVRYDMLKVLLRKLATYGAQNVTLNVGDRSAAALSGDSR